jgi:hypothetical protein
MYLIARVDRLNGAESDWLVDISPMAGQIEVTRTRRNARRFKSEADAFRVCNMVQGIATSDAWKVVEA